MSKKKYTGKSIVVDMYSCSADIISQPEAALEALKNFCAENNIEIYKSDICSEDDRPEYSIFVICKRGHIILHVYPEIGFVTADVFICGEGTDPGAVSRAIRSYFDTEKSRITLLDRGDFGSEADMKPQRNSKIKLIRRTKNLGRKLKKIMLEPRSL